MESKHKELLDKCYQNLLESITHADRVVEVLSQTGTLTQSERYELGHNCSSNSEKVVLLLKILISKERDHFKDLCAALEKTHPHLNSALLMNGVGEVDHSSGSTYSVLSTMPSDSESSTSLSSAGTMGQASSPPPAHMENRHGQMSEKMEAVLFQLRQVTRERDELRKRLALSSPGTTFDDCRYSRTLGQDYEHLKLQCMKAMVDLQSLQNQHSTTLKRCEEAVKKADFYHTLHSRLAGEQSPLKEELDAVRQDNIQLVREHNHVKQSCEEMRRLHDEDQRQLGDMRLLHQQVLEDGSSEILNKLYDTAMDKLEGTKRDYEALRKRFNEKTANHNTDLSRLEQAEEENRRLQKQVDMLLKQRDAATHYQQQYSTSMRRFDSTQAELSKAAVQNKELQREMERLQTESTRLKTQQLKAVKDCEKYKEERDSVFNEYRLIMSERDQVITEVDKLQTGLEVAEAKLKNTSSEKRMTSEEMEALRQKQDSTTLDMERANKEIEVLRKQYEAMSQELKEATQEAEVAKCRRDWAFQERDKIVAERESIRTLCDNLRRERDRAVSDLADVLRNLDDTRKQKNDASRELKELKERIEDQLEKEASFRQLMAHNSHDSAIDTDSLEWETEVVEFEKNRVSEDMDLKALGFDVAEGINEPYLPGDCGIFVSKVDRGGIAEGRLRVNDWLLKINNVDLTNKDRKQVLKAVLSGEGVINMVVRRRKSLGGRLITPIEINLTGYKASGIGLECGVFVAGVTPGSPATKEGSLTVGDRLIAINGIALDNKSLSECEALLRSCRDALMTTCLLPQSCSGQSIFENLRDASERTSNCRSLHSWHSRNSKNNNSSTQTDMFCPDIGSSGGERHNYPNKDRSHSNVVTVDNNSRGGSICQHKPFSSSSMYSRSLSHRGNRDRGGDRDRGGEEGNTTTPEREKPSGGTWPKVLVGASILECAQLSIYKKPKQRKSIFDADTFKRPEASSKLDYLSLSQLSKHSPQDSQSEVGPGVGIGQTPPTPPQRSDSFRFKHRQQISSASDSTITTGTGTPPTPPGQAPDRDGDSEKHNYYIDPPGEGMQPIISSRKSCDEDVSRQRGEELDRDRRRYRPKSAPASYNIAQHRYVIIGCMNLMTVFFSYSPQHQGRLSLDLSHKRSGDLTSDSSPCSQTPHSTNSLPSSTRLGSSGNLHFRHERIKISPTRYPRSVAGSDRGSLSHSECSSLSHSTPPMSPANLETASFASSQSQSSISTSATQPRISASPALIGDRRKDRPYLEEPRNVTLQKGAEPLGISIVSGENGGVFVSKVTAGSIAHQARLEYGDQLLEFNGINLRNANEQQARLVIGQQCDTITILAQYNPHMFQLGNHSRSSSRMESISGQPTPQLSGATTPDNPSVIDTLSEQDEGTMTPPSKQTTPATSSRRAPEVRLVRLKKPQGELGVQLCGGNLYGIYVESLEDDSPAKCPDGLVPGDQILEYNGVNMKNKTAEEAYLEMLKPAETVMFKVQHRLDELAMLKDSPGDGFYIRALYERVAEMELELSFKKDDILYIEDTLPKGNFGFWMAWQLDESARKLARGQVPSKYIMDQEFYRRHSMPDMKDESGTASKTLSAAARRSFFRRKQKHKRSGSKDGKDLVDAISTDSLPIMEDGVSLAYQRIQKVECSSPRPVLVLGPLVEANKDMLVKEAPGRFCRCLPEVMKASQQAIERGVKDCVFIDFKRRSGHFDVTTVASIKEITEKDCHCLLDIAPHAIERLHSVHIYPIVIFIRYKNAKQIKEQKDPLYLRDKVSQKHSKEQFEMAQKTEQEYSKVFTGIVQGGSLSYICTQIMTIVDQEQSKVIWIPDGAF
uniref:Discs large MAGUK scaffold protein 5 n=1 Tax=Oncorhynchus kisutch TaxID=8019 RepID=A0A8C7FQ07_ONCKI